MVTLITFVVGLCVVFLIRHCRRETRKAIILESRFSKFELWTAGKKCNIAVADHKRYGTGVTFCFVIYEPELDRWEEVEDSRQTVTEDNMRRMLLRMKFRQRSFYETVVLITGERGSVCG